jgi:hypothetical protein
MTVQQYKMFWSGTFFGPTWVFAGPHLTKNPGYASDNSSNFALHYHKVSFKTLHYSKRVLDTEMNGYLCFNFYRKTFLRSVDPKQPKMSNFHFDLSLKLSQGEVHDFSGEVQKLSREVQNDLRGGAHLPTPPLKIRP